MNKEKILPPGIVHKIAREESRQQYKRDFRRLKSSIGKEIATKLEGNSFSKRTNHMKQFSRKNANATSNANVAPPPSASTSSSTTLNNRENHRNNQQNNTGNNKDNSHKNKKSNSHKDSRKTNYNNNNRKNNNKNNHNNSSKSKSNYQQTNNNNNSNSNMSNKRYRLSSHNETNNVEYNNVVDNNNSRDAIVNVQQPSQERRKLDFTPPQNDSTEGLNYNRVEDSSSYSENQRRDYGTQQNQNTTREVMVEEEGANGPDFVKQRCQ